MIISASYRTDIAAFYGDWFINRLRQGCCKVTNPYNGQASRVSLTPDEVDGFVFWTKNVTPFLKHLREVRDRGFPFVVQHAINAYPRVLEHAITDAARSVRNVREIAVEYGPKVCVWRYDPVVFTSLTPPERHEQNFAQLAEQLRGATDEVVVSFAQFYRKTLRNMTRAAAESGFSWWDPPASEKRTFVSRLAAIAQRHGLRLSVCSQREYVVAGTSEARCIDAARFEQITGKCYVTRLKGNRKECGCYEARDIGEYNTCPHGCVYCYAVEDHGVAHARYRQHNPGSEFLLSPPSPPTETRPHGQVQLPLFPGG